MKDPSGGITVLCDRISPCMKLQEPFEAVDPGLKLAGVTNLPCRGDELGFHFRSNRIRGRGGVAGPRKLLPGSLAFGPLLDN